LLCLLRPSLSTKCSVMRGALASLLQTQCWCEGRLDDSLAYAILDEDFMFLNFSSCISFWRFAGHCDCWSLHIAMRKSNYMLRLSAQNSIASSFKISRIHMNEVSQLSTCDHFVSSGKWRLRMSLNSFKYHDLADLLESEIPPSTSAHRINPDHGLVIFSHGCKR
jgi:hypothetical protein